MNKLLLTLSAVALGASSLFAAPAGFSAVPFQGEAIAKAPASRAGEEGSMDFTLAGAPSSAYRLNNARKGSIVYLAFEFLPANCKMFAGAQVTAVSFYSAVNGNTQKNDINEVEAFIIPEANGEDFNPIVSKTATIGSTPNAYCTIAFDEPYTIKEDETFAVGYKFKVASINDFYLVVDEIPTTNLAGGWFAVGESGKMEWNNIASELGTLCIYATIKGDNLPKDGVKVPLVAVPSNVEPDQEFKATVTLANTASNSVNSVELEYYIEGQEPATKEVTLLSPIYYGQTYTTSISKLTFGEQKAGVPFTVTVTKVNGQPNTDTNASYTANFNCYDFASAYPHTYLLEEGTGTWCGWCPRGIVAMEYVSENYPEQFAGVAIHNGDEMAMSNNGEILTYIGITGFPSMMIDRTSFSDMSKTSEFDNLAKADAKSLAAVAELVGKIDSKGNIGITSSAKFLLDTKNSNDRYRMSYYITENGVGPYDQTNYYSGGNAGKLNGWETKPQSVSTIYNEVARVLVGDLPGIEGSIPYSLKAGQAYEFYTETKLDKVSDNPYFVTAFIIDNVTGEVVNSKQAQLVVDETGLADAAAEAKLAVIGSNGAIILNGQYTAATVYNVAGQLVATAAGESTIALPAGLYIVKADDTTAKVIVK